MVLVYIQGGTALYRSVTGRTLGYVTSQPPAYVLLLLLLLLYYVQLKTYSN